MFRNWKGLSVLGVLPDSVSNPNTALQVKARELLSFCSKSWKDLSFAIKDEWDSVAEYLSTQWSNYENEVGSHIVIRTPKGPFTGLDAIVSAHSLLGSIDEWDSADALIEAPVSITAPTQVTNLEASGDTDSLILTWTDPASWGSGGSAGKIRIWAKSEDGTFFAQLVKSTAAAAETDNFNKLRPAGGGSAIAITPGPYYIQLDAVNAEGLRSAPSAVARILLEAPSPP